MKNNLQRNSSGKLRVLTVSHAHPDFSKGGGEVAAYNLYLGLKDDPRVEAAWFIGAKANEATGGISMLREDEYIWRQGIGQPFLMKALVPNSTLRDFPALLERLKPNVIHFHHYVHVGIEAIDVARQVCPDAKIVLTLHEMLAICLSDGQMVKKKNFALCNKSSDQDCHQCFPEYAPEDFWLRRRFYLKQFSNVDVFISPSQFLKDRYVAWGLPEDKVAVIENGLPSLGPVKHRPLLPKETRNRIGFFGQITLYKGVDVLLEALTMLPEETAKKISLEIHGANLENQKPEFQEKIKKLLDPLVENGVVRMMGPYTRDELYERMVAVDWVIVPSIWWENSPVVIQEALSLGKPVICSDIGGMKEKVKDRVDGLHFKARSVNSLAAVFTDVAEEKVDWATLSKQIKCMADVTECTQQVMALY